MDLRTLIRDLYGIDRPQGCTAEEITAMRKSFGTIPPVLEDFWRIAGHTDEVHFNQDDWLFPEDFQKSGYMTRFEDLRLFCENQACCWAGIRRKDLTLPDPPVYTQESEDEPWLLSAPTTSAFLEAALTYEAAWRLPYRPAAFFELSDGDLSVIRAKLEQRPCALDNWMGMNLTFYSNRPDNLVVLMDMDGEYQAIYGGATRESYEALLEVMEGLGEPV